MLPLSELQKKFVAALNQTSTDVLNYIQSGLILSAAAHLAIYQGSIKGSLQKTLKDIYPVCHKLVGEEFFLGMIDKYIADHPSRSANLGEYGEQFATFIMHFAPTNVLPYLADVARLEWAWHYAFTAPDETGMDFQRLQDCYSNTGENIVFCLPKRSFLLKSNYPIQRIWEVNQDDFIGDQTIVLEQEQSHFFLVFRKELTMRIDPLTAIEWQILNWVKSELPLGKLCEKVSIDYPEVSISEILGHFTAQGWLASFYVLENG